MLSEIQSTLQLKQKHAIHKYPYISVVYKQLEINVNNQNIQNNKHFYTASTHKRFKRMLFTRTKHTFIKYITKHIIIQINSVLLNLLVLGC